MVLGQLAAGRTVDEVIADYPYVERDDVLAAVKYAAAAVKEPEVPDVGNTRPDRASLRTSDPARVRRRHVRRPTSADSGDVDANPILLLPKRILDAGLAGGRLPRSGTVRISSYFRTL
jgi:hypothetical protein